LLLRVVVFKLRKELYMVEKLNIRLNTWGEIKTDRTKDIQREKLMRTTEILQQNTFEYIFYPKNTDTSRF